jgi:urease accessory protein
MMAVGGFLALIGVELPAVEIGIAVSAIALGMMVAVEARPRIVIAAVIVGVFAIFHGYAHGTELPEGQSGVTYSVGFVISTGLLHAAGIAIGLIHRWRSGAKALQFVGGAIAIAGVWFLWRAIK